MIDLKALLLGVNARNALLGDARQLLREIAAITVLLVWSYLPRMVLGAEVGADHAIVNLDFLLVAICAALFGKFWAIVMYVGVLLLDAAVFIAATFHQNVFELIVFNRFGDNLQWANSSYLLWRVLSWLVVGASGGAALYWVLPSRRMRFSIIALVTAGVLTALDPWGHRGGWIWRAAGIQSKAMAALPINVVTSGLLAVSSDLRHYAASRTPGAWLPADSAMQNALFPEGYPNSAPQVRGRNLMLVIVESWGLPLQAGGLDEQLTPLLTPQVRLGFGVTTGSVSFRGATTAAELRELCGASYRYQWVISEGTKRECLPSLFGRAGFQVRGIHGFSGQFFDRYLWWPRIGLSKGEFLDDLSKGSHAPLCGLLFLGVCDQWLVEYAGQVLHNPGRHFVYLLTLNSHLPLPARNNAGKSGSEQASLEEQLRIVLASLGRLASEQEAGETEFVIVGDHAPPLSKEAERATYSATHVPFVHLVPVEGAIADKRIGADKKFKPALRHSQLRGMGLISSPDLAPAGRIDPSGARIAPCQLPNPSAIIARRPPVA